MDRGAWTAKTVKRPRQQPAHPQYANYWAPLTHKRHTMPQPAQPQHTNHWAPRTRKQHQQEHQPQRPTASSNPTQHVKERTGNCPGPRKETTTRRSVTQGGGGRSLRPLANSIIRGEGAGGLHSFGITLLLFACTEGEGGEGQTRIRTKRNCKEEVPPLPRVQTPPLRIPSYPSKSPEKNFLRRLWRRCSVCSSGSCSGCESAVHIEWHVSVKMDCHELILSSCGHRFCHKCIALSLPLHCDLF